MRRVEMVNEELLRSALLLGMLGAAASLGSIMLWDVDEGLAQIDK